MKEKRVLIAQLNVLTPYRLRFYELLEERRPRWWTFDVVHDTDPDRAKQIFPVFVDPKSVGFPILPVRTFFLSRTRRDRVWQTFFLKARHYDLVVTDTYIKNLTYVAVTFWKILGKRRGYWGISGNRFLFPHEQGDLFLLSEKFKRSLFRISDIIFAYTNGEKRNFLELGIPESKIVVLNNTIDVHELHKDYMQLADERDGIRKRLGLEGRDVILYLGRLTKEKRLSLLLEAFKELVSFRPSAYLIIAGGGPEREKVEQFAKELGSRHVRYYRPLGDEFVDAHCSKTASSGEIIRNQNQDSLINSKGIMEDGAAPRDDSQPIKAGELFVASDLFCLPGQVGLAPITAFCYHLPAVVCDVPINSCEFEYLSSTNSTILPPDLTPQQFARELARALDEWRSSERRSQIFPSISHLTMEAMVDNFIEGVNRALGT